VRRYEADPSGYASPIAILNWAEEAKFFASAQAGWSIQQAAEAGLVVVQIRHDSEFFQPLAVGDEVEILSRIIELRKVRGTWEHRFYRDGRLVAVDYSAGAFLTRDGRPRLAPQEMLEALRAGQGPPVVSVVAKSGTGKTTFMERLIPALKDRGLRVGVVKHHGHPTSFDVPGKDTYRHAQAGADVVVGASAVQVAIFRQEDGSADLDEVIARHCGGLDIVLTEGYKRGSYPKIEVHRSERSDELLCGPEELLALVSDTAWSLDVPQFGLEDAAGVADFLVRWCLGGRRR
jgi:molybdopterin-guanine dinucleotide biosynthesis protein B